MKLLFCPDCKDMFNLMFKHKTCECGKVSGKYINNTDAVTNGEGISVAIGNGSFEIAVNTMILSGNNKDRDYYLEQCRVICWVRPNDGSGNLHTTIEEEICV